MVVIFISKSRANFMDDNKFIKKLYNSINQNKLINELFNDEYRFFRRRLIFKIIDSLCKILNYFYFQNDIIIENKIPFTS